MGKSDAMRRRLPATLLGLALLGAMAPAHATAAPNQWRFPMRAPHNYGTLDVTGFGVKRGDGSIHTGQDVIANCGEPLVAPHRSVVRERGRSEGYGFYLVLDGEGTKFDFVYGHMKGRARLKRGQDVKAGQRVGSVGSTGTDVCHLHFEMWSGRWFDGGRRIDPLPHLRKWDKHSGGPLQTEPVPVGQDSSSARLFRDAAE
jgi:murein DD-endopeptidase MepM/ murein hydrolase activator NlpD